MPTPDPLANLDYFTEWGGRAWKSLLRFAITQLQKDNFLNDAELLDVGTRYGKMAVLFSLLGARVTGVDIHEEPLAQARAEALKWNTPGVKFMTYQGDLNVFADNSFDVIFTKSVLVLIPTLEPFLMQVRAKLKPEGRIVFLENAKGNALLHRLRALKHRSWDYTVANYFTNREVELIRSLFRVDTVKRTLFPPVYLFVGRNRK